MARILAVDDERSIRNTLRDILEFEKYKVETAQNGVEALEMVATNKYDLIFSDIKMPEMDGIELLKKIVQMDSTLPIVMMSGQGSVETVVQCIKTGAYDYIEKPIDLNRLLKTTKNALERSAPAIETKAPKRKVERKHQMIGSSPSIQRVRDMISRIAPTSARVLITGENGTGKEVVAQHIYSNSKRAGAPFVEVNCAAIPSELIESELFGHEKGAFTSAVKQRIGKFEQAHGGTIFLDEIGDMSLSAQTKVLRALQENKISRVGSDKDVKVDVRILAATNKDLKAEIAKGTFREDLFHRLSVIPIHVPSLNERKEDIPELVAHFSSLICAEQAISEKRFAKGAIEALQERNWTGNIRELRNVVERLLILAEDSITADDIRMFS